MKHILLILAVAFTLAAPLAASHSLQFSTAVGTDFAWQLTGTDGDWTLSFADTAIDVDDSDPEDPALAGDFVLLPDMALTEITSVEPELLRATLTPQGPLTVQSNPGGDTVLTASQETGTIFFTGTTYASYPVPGDDLDVIDFDDTYSIAIPAIAAAENAGLPLDISFTGDLVGGGNLRRLILCGSGTARGTLSGQITVIPSAGSLLLSSVGMLIVGWLRATRRL